MNKKIIDLSGYSFSGKGAYNNLFAEFDGCYVHPYAFEFDLFRTRNGILDLYIALIQEWSPVRSSEAIRGFKNLIKVYGGTDSFISRLTSLGRRYDQMFPGFTKTSNKYIDDLVDFSWEGLWPFAFENTTRFKVFVYKVLKYLGYKTIFEKPIFLSSPTEDEFIYKTNKYLNDILFMNISEKVSTVVTNNVFEPFNPLKSMKLLDNAKSIVIDRNPCDIYLAASLYVYPNGVKGVRATLGSNVEEFIKKFKIYRSKVSSQDDKSILRLSFEDLVLKYDITRKRIFDFIEEDESIHVAPKKYFDPEISRKGVGMWKNVQGQLKKDVEKIYLELKEYCIEI